MIILKNSEKFSVFKTTDKNNKNIILKIANKNPRKILREIKLIKILCSSSKFFKNSIPDILEHGYFKKGLFKNKGYYKQKYIPGLTFSQIIQNEPISKVKLQTILKILIKKFLVPIRGSKFIKNKRNPANLLSKMIYFEYKKITDKYLLSSLEKSKSIYIDRQKYKNIKFYLKKILNSKSIKKLNKEFFFLSDIGHWNFHGGNIIFPNKKNYNNFSLIDPDATWDLNDPFFSLERFIYTYPHDTMEYNKYLIYSYNLQKIENKNKLIFKHKTLWKKNTSKKYNYVFSEFYKKNFKKKNLLQNSLNKKEYLRYNLSLILCFMRGINSNFEPKLNFLDKKAFIFQNKGIYLYLLTLERLKILENYLDQKNE